MSDADRKQIETDTKTLLTTLSNAINKLSQAANAEAEARKLISQRARSKRGFGVLGRWAAGADSAPARTEAEILEDAKVEGVQLHRDGVLWFLQRRLEAVSEIQRNMVAVRLQRAVERNKSSLHRAGIGSSSTLTEMEISRTIGVDGQQASASKAVDLEHESEQPSLESLLSPEQIQMFEQEQDSMVKFYNTELQKIK